MDDDSPILRISLKDVKVNSKVPKNINLDEYTEVSKKYIKLLKGCWIKYTDRSSFVTFQGGFLYAFDQETISLRNIKQEVFTLNLTDYIFYCKTDNESYQAVKEIILEKEKLMNKIQEFERQKARFFEEKRVFFLKQEK